MYMCLELTKFLKGCEESNKLLNGIPRLQWVNFSLTYLYFSFNSIKKSNKIIKFENGADKMAMGKGACQQA